MLLSEQAALRGAVETVLRLCLLPGQPHHHLTSDTMEVSSSPLHRITVGLCLCLDEGVSEKAGAQAGPGFLPAETSPTPHQIPAAAEGRCEGALMLLCLWEWWICAQNAPKCTIQVLITLTILNCQGVCYRSLPLGVAALAVLLCVCGFSCLCLDVWASSCVLRSS